MCADLTRGSVLLRATWSGVRVLTELVWKENRLRLQKGQALSAGKGFQRREGPRGPWSLPPSSVPQMTFLYPIYLLSFFGDRLGHGALHVMLQGGPGYPRSEQVCGQEGQQPLMQCSCMAPQELCSLRLRPREEALGSAAPRGKQVRPAPRTKPGTYSLPSRHAHSGQAALSWCTLPTLTSSHSMEDGAGAFLL